MPAPRASAASLRPFNSQHSKRMSTPLTLIGSHDFELHFPQLERRIVAHDNETLYQSARRHGVRIVGACGGRGTCGSCVVRVLEGVTERTVKESAGVFEIDESDAPQSRRRWQRACQISARSACTIEIAPRSLASVVRTETDDGHKEMLPLAAAVTPIDLAVPEAILHRSGLINDYGRLATGHPDIVPHAGKRAVQLAKAAVRTATELLLEEAGVRSSASSSPALSAPTSMSRAASRSAYSRPWRTNASSRSATLPAWVCARCWRPPGRVREQRNWPDAAGTWS